MHQKSKCKLNNTIRSNIKLTHVLFVFIEQNIDGSDILVYLSEEQIDELTKNIGDKIKLKKLIDFVKNENEVSMKKNCILYRYSKSL